MPLVTMPDGQLVDMPDNPSPEQLAGLQALAQRQSAIPEGVKEAGRVLDQTVRGGLTALPRMAKSLFEATGGKRRADEAEQALPEMFRRSDSSRARDEAASAELEKLMTPLKPKTKSGQVIGNIGEAAVGALASPGGMAAPVRSAVTGAASGAGAEGAAALFGDNALTRLIGGLLGGGASSLVMTSPTNRAQVAKAALRDVDEIDLQNAKAVMAERAAAGTPVNLSQAMGRDSNIDKLVDVLANSKEGVNTVNMLRAQPAQVEGQATGFLNSLPGNVLPRSNMANQAQEAATEVLNQAKGTRTKIWEQALARGQAAGGGMAAPIDAVENVRKFLAAEAAAKPNTQQAAWLQQLSTRLVDDVGMPLTDPKQLNEVLKEAAASLKMPNMNTPGIDAGASRYLSGVIQQTRDQLGDSFAPIRDANAAYRGFTQARINPLRQGSVGAIAQPAGAQEDKAAAAGKLFSMFDRGSDPRAKVSDIGTFAKELNKSGQGDVFTNGVKSWMSEKLAQGMKEAGGRSSDDVAEVIHKSFFRTDLQKQGFRDMMAGVADAQGVPRKDLVDGAEKFFSYVGQAARRPANTSGISGEEFRRVAEGSLFGKLGQVSVITPLRQPVLKWVDWLRSDAYSAMDKLVTSPEGVDMLIKLAKEKSMSPAAVNAMATFLGTATAANNPPTITAE